MLDRAGRAAVRAIVSSEEAGLEQVLEEIMVQGLTPRHAAAGVRSLAIEAKAKFGLLTRTVENRELVKRYLLRLCEQKKIEPRHAVAMVPQAVIWAFVPGESDIEAVKISFSDDVDRALACHSASYNRESRWGRVLRALRLKPPPNQGLRFASK